MNDTPAGRTDGIHRCFGCKNLIRLDEAEVDASGILLCRRHCASRRETLVGPDPRIQVEIIG